MSHAKRMRKKITDRAVDRFHHAMETTQLNTAPETTKARPCETPEQMQAIFDLYRNMFGPDAIIVDLVNNKFNLWAESFQPKTWDDKARKWVPAPPGHAVVQLKNGTMLGMMSAKLWNQFIVMAEEGEE